MGFRYDIKMTPPSGGIPSAGPPFASISATRAKNSVGAATFIYSLDYARLFELDSQLAIWESIDGGPMRLWGETIWLVDVIDEDEQAKTVTIQASDLLTLVDRRIIAYAAGSAQTIANGPLDNEIKAIVRENLSSLATDTTRQLAATLFSIQADQSLAPTSQKRFAWRNSALDVIRDMCDDSAQLGTPLYVDVVAQSEAAFQFRTFPTYRGTDRRSGVARVLVGTAYGNIAGARYVRNWKQECNAAYAGGQGDEAARLIGAKVDTSRMMGPFGRREHFYSVTQDVTTQAEADAEAQAALYAGRPLGIFSGNFVDTPHVRFGRDLFYGDLIRAEALGRSFDCRIDTVTLTVNAAGRTIDAGLRSESYG